MTNLRNAIRFVNAKKIRKDELNNSNNTVDLVMFMGQSNMAGRGDATKAPIVTSGQGYEFRAISDPNKLYDVVEPFGVNENNPNGIYEPDMKTGSAVSSFIINYYKHTKVPIVGVSASKGGSSINEWKPGGAYLNDSIARLNSSRIWLGNNGYALRHQFMVWLQGETDGDNNMTQAEYATKIATMIDEMVDNQGLEKCYLIRIGNQRDMPTQYENIIAAQTDLCRNYSKVVLVSARLAGYARIGLMKDLFHYLQPAYNEFGAEAGTNSAFYINNGKQPTMYDAQYNNLYFSHKF